MLKRSKIREISYENHIYMIIPFLKEKNKKIIPLISNFTIFSIFLSYTVVLNNNNL